MHVPSEKLVETIVRAVLAELSRQGVTLDAPVDKSNRSRERENIHGQRVVIDYSDYKTPVLTEAHVRSLAVSTREIVVPKGTICTVGAADLIAAKKLVLSFADPSS